MPLRHRRPVLKPSAPGGGVAAQLPRDRRRRAPDLPRDLTHALALGAQQGDVLALGEAQVPPRRRVQADRRHPTTLTKPPDADRTAPPPPPKPAGRHPPGTPGQGRPPKGLCPRARPLAKTNGGDQSAGPAAVPATASAPAPPSPTPALHRPSQRPLVKVLRRP